jgi:hypothetical protein
MKDKLKGAVITLAAIAALALGGTAIAGATGGGDDDKTDRPIGGQALDRAKTVALDHAGGGGDREAQPPGPALTAASTAALRHTGGGRVTGTEVGDEEGDYEVEVTRADGSQVDVHLDKGFNVINQADDGEQENGNDD